MGNMLQAISVVALSRNSLAIAPESIPFSPEKCTLKILLGVFFFSSLCQRLSWLSSVSPLCTTRKICLEQSMPFQSAAIASGTLGYFFPVSDPLMLTFSDVITAPPEALYLISPSNAACISLARISSCAIAGSNLAFLVRGTWYSSVSLVSLTESISSSSCVHLSDVC